MSLPKIDILVGQDNLGKFVVDEIIVHLSEEFGIIKTKLGWTLGGSICINSPTKWERNKSERNFIIMIETEGSKDKIEEALIKPFKAERETANETTYTQDQIYALENVKRDIKVEKDGRYTVNLLFKENSKPLKNNYYHALAKYKDVRKVQPETRERKKFITRLFKKR